jgi:Transposase DDE domain
MYLRTVQRKNRDGTLVRYVQLAHNVRHSESKNPVAQVLHSFGREDQLDRATLQRLVSSINRYLEPQAEPDLTAPGGEWLFVASRRLGGVWTLDGLWHALGLDQVLGRLLAGRRADARMERVLFALVANRALAPRSKLAVTGWVARKVAISGLSELDEDTCYRAMDLLLDFEPELAQQVYHNIADLLDLEVDLLFFDTTSTYFEIDSPDAAVVRDATGAALPEDTGTQDANTPGAEPDAGGEAPPVAAFRSFGHSKDHRPDLPQIVIGMAVTRTGIPIRVWSWPGSTNDSALIRQVKDDLRGWKLGRAVWVADAGFASATNRRYLQRAGGHYIIAEKLRGDSKEAAAALSRAGSYHTVAGNLRIKHVVIDEGVMRDRFVVCHNPEQAARDHAIRTELTDQLQARIAGSDRLPAEARATLAAEIKATRGVGRYLRTTTKGLLRIDRNAVRGERRLDGKFLLRTSDPTLTPEDIAAGYKQLLEVERGWRDLKTTLDLRPVYHRKEERIRAHVLLCWLALLLIRIAETTTGDTWRNLREELDCLHVGEFTGTVGGVQQRTEITDRQHEIFRILNIDEPPKLIQAIPV